MPTKLFFDCEFTGLHKNTNLISIGIISEDGRTFYGEIIDYDKKQVDDWLQDNVINNLLFNDKETYHNIINEDPSGKKHSIEIKDNKKTVGLALTSWLYSQFKEIEWVSDVCHYDMVLLIDLITNGGSALDIPYGVWSSSCYDINQDIAKHYNQTQIKAFDMSREEILKMNHIKLSEEEVKHNSLYDAKVIREIYNLLNE